jgi:hypothetical protein
MTKEAPGMKKLFDSIIGPYLIVPMVVALIGAGIYLILH